MATAATNDPRGITTGPDGALWFADDAANQIGRMSVTGELTQYDGGQPDLNAQTYPFGIAVGPDDNIWFTDAGAGFIGQLTLPQTPIRLTAASPTQSPTLSWNAVRRRQLVQRLP